MTNVENLPEFLRKNGLFCLWRYEARDGRRTKVPYNPNDPQRRAESNNPLTFTGLDIAKARASGFDGLGVGIFGRVGGIDIDHCIQGGKLSDMAKDIVETMDAYTEISPSGEGLRILFLAPSFQYDSDKFFIKNSQLGLEIYLPGMTRRYLTVTGNTLRPVDMVDRTERLQAILDKYMVRPQKATQPIQAQGGYLDLSDEDLLAKARNARNGEQFSSLWSGDISGYPSHSEADQALCNQLAFWTGKDSARMDALFRRSGLYRDKWNRRQSGTTYGAITIRKAIATCSEVYTPPQERPQAPQTAPKPAVDKNHTEGEGRLQEATQGRKTGLQIFDEFMAKVQTDAYRPLKTGLPAFDSLLGGGIPKQSLVILTAAPGTGKTALAQQIFEVMAKAGTEVIYLNLEMSKEVMYARSLSRICHRQGNKGISSADVLRGYLWNDRQKASIMQAAEEYRSVAENLIYPDVGTSLTAILGVLDRFAEIARETGRSAPAVCVDYLHLITADKGEDQAEILKRAVKAFKDYAVMHDTFVLAIGASNRDSNKSGKVSLASGRDTSALEYSADISIGLNYAALAEKRKKPDGKLYDADDPDDMMNLQSGDGSGNREMVVQVLKHRLFEPGKKLMLLFNPKASIFYPLTNKHGEFNHIEDEDNPFI